MKNVNVKEKNYNMGKTCKVVVCGMKGVGKTSILEQAIYGHLTEKTVGTLPQFVPWRYLWFS